ncbi:MAG: Ig-like domain-containing protein [Tannerellaceae bacterium]|nr:Ig-like domain-containing protein [Tannerellaceae bacterium]
MSTQSTPASAGCGSKSFGIFALAWVAGFLPAEAQSPYIHKVYDYMPAPGQFVNELPAYALGDTPGDMNRKAEEYIAGANHNKGLITLGGYGGYVVFGFDHEVENLAGRYDFRILGNAFYADSNPNQTASREGGSCEPGIVLVARDDNGNGLPDDTWYELAGSDYHRSTTLGNYRITYYRPDGNKPPVPHPTYPYLNDMEYIRWETNGYGSGYLYRNTFHDQSYYPLWVEEATLTFSGSRLADNYVDESGQGLYYVQYASHWGYADNQPNHDARSAFNIEWAVDADGKPVSLPGIRFVKVYTAVNQYCGWLGETSTEIAGAIDLHLAGGDLPTPVFVSGISLDRSSATLNPGETLALVATLAPAEATNRGVTWESLAPEIATVNAGLVTALSPGLARIRAIANDGYYLAECLLTVSSLSPAPAPAPGEIPVTGVSLSPSGVVEMLPGEMRLLTALVTPAEATNREVEWSSSSPQVVEVTVNGLLLACAPGTATVTVITNEGGYRADCVVNVASNSSPASTESPLPQAESPLPQAHYADGQLRLLYLEGYRCSLFTLSGLRISDFSPLSSDVLHPLSLPSGLYILRARKPGKESLFKLWIGQ